MPLGTEYSFGAGDIRAAAAAVDALELPDDEGVQFEFDDDRGAYYVDHPYSGDRYWIVEDRQLIDDPASPGKGVVAIRGGWTIFDEDPWGS